MVGFTKLYRRKFAEEMRKGPTDRGHPRGFTLAELMLVVAILGMLLVLGMPSLAQFSSGYRLREAAREVASDLQYARILAIKENQSLRVDFSPSSYRVVRVSDETEAKSRSFSTDYPDVTLSSVSIIFDSRGTSSTSTLTVTNSRGTKSITVASSGKVKIQ